MLTVSSLWHLKESRQNWWVVKCTQNQFTAAIYHNNAESWKQDKICLPCLQKEISSEDTTRTDDFVALQFFHFCFQTEIASAEIHKKAVMLEKKSLIDPHQKGFDLIHFQNMNKILHWVRLCIVWSVLNLIEMCVSGI